MQQVEYCWVVDTPGGGDSQLKLWQYQWKMSTSGSLYKANFTGSKLQIERILNYLQNELDEREENSTGIKNTEEYSWSQIKLKGFGFLELFSFSDYLAQNRSEMLGIISSPKLHFLDKLFIQLLVPVKN